MKIETNSLKNRFISVILMVAVLIAYMPFGWLGIAETAYADSEINSSDYGSWAEYAEDVIYNGTGSAIDYLVDSDGDEIYEINSAEDLAIFAWCVNNEAPDIWGQLTRSIDLQGKEWTPIGNFEMPFCGTFSGLVNEDTKECHTIEGLKISAENESICRGLFGCVEYGTVRHIKVIGEIESNANDNYIGGIAGYNLEGTIQYCGSEVDITVNHSDTYAGGIEGYGGGYDTVEYSYNRGDITVAGTAGAVYAGGITGYSIDPFFECVVNYGSIEGGSKSNRGNVGGIFGCADGWAMVSGAYNKGTVANGHGIVGTIADDFDAAYLCDASGCGSLDGGGQLEDSNAIKTPEDIAKKYSKYMTVTEDGVLHLKWETINHTDGGAVSESDKQTAINELKSYLSSHKSYSAYEAADPAEKKLVDDAVADAETKINACKTTSDIDTALQNAKSDVDLQLTKLVYINDINTEKARLKDVNEYTKEGSEQLDSIAAEYISKIKGAADAAEAGSFKADAITALGEVLTKAAEESLAQAKTNAQDKVAKLINEAEAKYNNALELTEDIPEAKSRIEAAHTAAGEELDKYNEGGTALEALGSCQNESAVTEWLTAAENAVKKIIGSFSFMEISSTDELQQFAEEVNTNKNYETNAVLTRDIDASVLSWTPVGNTEKAAYQGILLGNGKAVTIQQQESGNPVGFFGFINGAVIDGLTVKGTIKGKAYTGGIAGRAILSETDTVISNCRNEAQISGTGHVGGILGYATYASSSTSVGILKITGCTNSGIITTTGTTNYGAGGIAGYIAGYIASNQAFQISSCVNGGTVSGGSADTGGIVGRANTAGLVTDCENSGGVSGSGNLGGLIGQMWGPKNAENPALILIKSSNSGDVTGTGSSSSSVAGGLAGTVKYSQIQYSYNVGQVTLTGTSGYSGGLIGKISYEDGFKMSDSYNAGTVSGGARTGAIAGDRYNADILGKITGCYAVTVSSGTLVGKVTYVDGYTGIKSGEIIEFKTEAEMKSGDFVKLLNQDLGSTDENVFWLAQSYDDGTLMNNGFPVFKSQIEKLGALPAAKAEAVNDLNSSYNEDDYYETQWEQVKSAVSQAVAAINDKLTDTAEKVQAKLKQWKETISKIFKKTDIDSQLDEAKKKAIEQIDAFSQKYNEDNLPEAIWQVYKSDEFQAKLNSAVNEGKNSINNSITPEDFSAAEDGEKIVMDKAAEAKNQLSLLYHSIGIWDGTALTDAEKNSYKPKQDENGCYLISNAIELAWFAQAVNSGQNTINGKLTADIDLCGGKWIPIGNLNSGQNDTAYNGSFDGNGNKISGLLVDELYESGRNYAGLFGKVGGQGTVKNLRTEGKVQIAVNDYNANYVAGVGGIAGMSSGIIFNCSSSVTLVNASKLSGLNNFGGIAGNVDGGAVERCAFEGSITRSGGNAFLGAGGIVGTLSGSALVRYCIFTGNYGQEEGKSLGGNYPIGGIIGTAGGNSQIRECISKGSIKGAGFMGGIAGCLKENARAEYVYNMNLSLVNTDNNSNGSDAATGGLVGLIGDGNGESRLLHSFSIASGNGGNTKSGAAAGKVCSGGTISDTMALSGQGFSSLMGMAEASGVKVERVVFKDSLDGEYDCESWQKDSSELQYQKHYYTVLLIGMYKAKGDSTYGENVDQYNGIIDKYIRKIETVYSDETAAETLYNQALAELSTVPTQLDRDKEEAADKLRQYVISRVYDIEKNGEEPSDDEKINALLAEAVAEAEACKSIEEVNSVLIKYIGNEFTVGEFERCCDTYNTKACNELYDIFIYNKYYSIENAAVLLNIYEEWVARIEDAFDRETIEALYSQAYQALTEASSQMTETENPNANIPETAGSDFSAEGATEPSELDNYKSAQYNALVKKYAPNLYEQAQWAQVQETFATLKADLQNASDETAVDSIISSAKTALDDIPSREKLISERALELSKANAQGTLSQLVSELINNLEAFFNGKKEALGGEEAYNSLSQGLRGNIEGTYDTSRAEIETEGDKAEEIQQAENQSTVERILSAAAEKIRSTYESAVSRLTKLFENAANKDAWDGSAVSAPLQNEEGWYLITSPEELAWFAQEVNKNSESDRTINALLCNDIDLGSCEWIPIGRDAADGKQATPYRGTFDGQGHTVSGLYISDAGYKDSEGNNRRTGSTGLFGYINNAVIKNLNVDGEIIISREGSPGEESYVGGIAGRAEYSDLTGCTSYTDIRVEFNSNNPKGTGGIAGYFISKADSSSITECKYKGNITVTEVVDNIVAAYKGVGGIVGYIEGNNTKVSGCSNLGSISVEKGEGVGGIAGYISGGFELSCCSNHGYVGNDGYATEISQYPVYHAGVGGIAGIAPTSSAAVIRDVYNTGTVDAGKLGLIAGGIIGGESGTYGQSYTGGEMESTGSPGLTIEHCYNSGIIDGPNNQTAMRIGSLAGYPIKGNYQSELYVLDGAADSSMGWYSAQGEMVSSVAGETLKNLDNLPYMFTEAAGAINSFAGLNNGYPLFKWELVDIDMKTEINRYIDAYYGENVRDYLTTAKQNEIERKLTGLKTAISGAQNAETIIRAYNDAMTAMDISDILNGIKEEAKEQLDQIDTSQYGEEYKEAIAGIIAAGKAAVDKSNNGAQAEAAVNETYANIVELLIDSIEEFNPANMTEAQGTKAQKQIETARKAYEALNQTQKELVDNLIKLTGAETKLTEYKDRREAANVDSLILSIGKVTLSSGKAIRDARSAYSALTAAQKKYVKYLSVLQAAEKEYQRIYDLNRQAVEVANLIDAIGDVTLDSYDAIMKAMNAYNALSAGAAAYLGPGYVEKLKNAMNKYNEIYDATLSGEVAEDVIPSVNEGIASAAVTKERLEDMADIASKAKADRINISIADDGKNAASVELALSKEAFGSLTEKTSADLALINKYARIILNGEAIRSVVSGASGETLSLVTRLMDNPGKYAAALAGSKGRCYDIYFVDGEGNEIRTLDEKIMIQLRIPEKLADSNLEVKLLTGSKSNKTAEGRYVTVNGELFFEFSTDNLAKFILAEEMPEKNQNNNISGHSGNAASAKPGISGIYQKPEVSETNLISVESDGDEPNEILDYSNTDPALPGKKFDWSILFITAAIILAVAASGGLIKWFAAARNSRRRD